MATIDIKAVYADMLKCAQILEDIGADVKVAYTDMDDFLNKKMVFNGKQIYANWQSDARSVFEEKAKVIVDVFNKVQTECAEASNTLKAVIKEYENRDSELASTTLGKNITKKPLDFKHFGNMDSADWTGLKKPDYSSFIASAANIKPLEGIEIHEAHTLLYAGPGYWPGKPVTPVTPDDPNSPSSTTTPISNPVIQNVGVYAGPTVKPTDEPSNPKTLISNPVIHTEPLAVYAGPEYFNKQNKDDPNNPSNPTTPISNPNPVKPTVYAAPPVKPNDESNNQTSPTFDEGFVRPTRTPVYAPPSLMRANNTDNQTSPIFGRFESTIRPVYAPASLMPSNNTNNQTGLENMTTARRLVYAAAPVKPTDGSNKT